jgi:hypothetical protein
MWRFKLYFVEYVAGQLGNMHAYLSVIYLYQIRYHEEPTGASYKPILVFEVQSLPS